MSLKQAEKELKMETATERSAGNGLRIVELRAENLKRLVAIEIHPTSDIIEITGRNAAGKSSVLDAIAYACGGQKLCPTEPIRNGEEKASVSVKLDNGLQVTRTWTRKGSYLTVTNADGAEAGMSAPPPMETSHVHMDHPGRSDGPAAAPGRVLSAAAETESSDEETCHVLDCRCCDLDRGDGHRFHRPDPGLSNLPLPVRGGQGRGANATAFSAAVVCVALLVCAVGVTVLAAIRVVEWML